MLISKTINFLNQPDLKLPDGRTAQSLNRHELAHALVVLGVEGVDANTPKFESLKAYSDHLGKIGKTAVDQFKAQAAGGAA